ncbi:MAG: sel1 repeat family protein [Desulfobulbaceae bacterium]|uniref:Sel1 repeat family protein n=1 Tax=Candidatus Desulfobia pelagia TaxID=2841692 RepID=A0A8J6NCA9_9BACT|nr:sel1 repeat family protein [Candidatus Desulfobia pelagia]
MKNLFIPLLVILLLPFTSCASSVNSSKIDKLADAAGDGDSYSQLLLGYKYYNGQDVDQDFGKAMQWYRKSAEQGYADAQIYLGTMYHNGEGASVDYVQAHMWFNLAAAQGHDRGRELRDLIAEKMTPVQIAEAQKRALGWEARK